MVLNLRDIDLATNQSLVNPEVCWEAGYLVDGPEQTRSCTMFYTLEPGNRLGWHHNSVEEIQLVVAGTGELQRMDGILPLGDADIIRLEAGEEHDIRNTGTVDLRLVAYFPQSRVEHFWREDRWSPGGTRVTSSPSK